VIGMSIPNPLDAAWATFASKESGWDSQNTYYVSEKIFT